MLRKLGLFVAFFFVATCEPVLSQDVSDAFKAMEKSTSWTQDFKSMDVLLIATSSTKTELESIETSESRDAVRKRRILINKAGEFRIIEACGTKSICLLEGVERARESVFANVYIGDAKSARQVAFPSGAEGDFRRMYEDQSYFDNASGPRWEITTLPYKFMFTSPDTEIQAEFDRLTQTLFQCEEKNFHLETIQNADKKHIKVYRVRRLNPKTESSKSTTVTYKLEVSNEGFDHGLVTSIQVAWMKDEFQKEDYEDEKQLESYPKYSTEVRWKEVSTHDGQAAKVVPVHVVHTILRAGFSKSTQNITFDWKSVNNGDLELPSLSSCGEECLKMRMDIDEILRR